MYSETTKRCPKCKTVKAIAGFYVSRSSADGLSSWCVTCMRERGAESRQKLRAEVLAYFGGRCQHCDFGDPRALQVDHVDGDGHIDRKTMSRGPTLAEIEASPQRFQLLCANCNWIKRAEQAELGTGRARAIPQVRHAPRPNAKASQTACVHGHEFTPENTYRSQGHRRCRRCSLDRSAANYRAKKARESIVTADA